MYDALLELLAPRLKEAHANGEFACAAVYAFLLHDRYKSQLLRRLPGIKSAQLSKLRSVGGWLIFVCPVERVPDLPKTIDGLHEMTTLSAEQTEEACKKGVQLNQAARRAFRDECRVRPKS